jgi:membrane protease YdiL (CAAX protease family)
MSESNNPIPPSYPQQGYPQPQPQVYPQPQQPIYPPQSYPQPQPVYPQQNYLHQQSNYSQQGYPQPVYPQPQPTYPQQTYPQPVYPQGYAYQQYPQAAYQAYQQPVLSVKKSYPAQRYKKTVRRTAMLVAVSLIVFYVINVSSMLITMLTTMFVGVLTNVNFSSLASSGNDVARFMDEIGQGWIIGVASIIGIVLGALAFFILRGKRLVTTDLTRTNEKMKLKELLIMACLVMGIQALFALGQVFVGGLLESSGVTIPEETDIFAQMMNLPGLLYIVLLGPIVEEIMFRGAIMRALQPYGQNFAIVVSSLLFGVYHLIFLQGIFAFFVGLVLAYCAMRFSLKWAMLLHIMNNGISAALMYFNASDNLMIAIMFVQLSLGLIVVLLVFSRFKVQRKIGKPTSVAIVSETVGTPWEPLAAAVKPRPYALTFSSPLIIIGLCVAAALMAVTPLLM